MALPSVKTLSLLLECLNNYRPLKLNYSVVIYLTHHKRQRRTVRKYVVCKWITKRTKVNHKVQKENICAYRYETLRIIDVVNYLQEEYQNITKN